ncbi:hypothetical protein SAMN04488074_101933 [Lentzea albidocapillata subsp. violacea]|uniref:Neocarzinostatin family protein n=1 Tax=Lentzea albidocapillata subsp. violacea TaxID=128104 RepID=A0A1G8SBQ5_9PSEU|nr:hypothetical protein [Lentzea albidocapillata]SDJ26631.1 hypothetical protein SAMN04488074_101933 [Lentzea albidocapillata subsp. violacea]
MRILKRAGLALGAMALLAVTTAGTASAAPSSFDVVVKHSSGVIVGRLTGNIAWSSSGRTVMLTNQYLSVKTGECVEGAFAGYQGNTVVAGPATLAPQCASTPVGDVSLGTTVVGGIHRANIQLIDYVHRNKASVACHRTASVCTP